MTFLSATRLRSMPTENQKYGRWTWPVGQNIYVCGSDPSSCFENRTDYFYVDNSIRITLQFLSQNHWQASLVVPCRITWVLAILCTRRQDAVTHRISARRATFSSCRP
jgi:hypothetical protein